MTGLMDLNFGPDPSQEQSNQPSKSNTEKLHDHFIGEENKRKKWDES